MQFHCARCGLPLLQFDCARYRLAFMQFHYAWYRLASMQFHCARYRKALMQFHCARCGLTLTQFHCARCGLPLLQFDCARYRLALMQFHCAWYRLASMQFHCARYRKALLQFHCTRYRLALMEFHCARFILASMQFDWAEGGLCRAECCNVKAASDKVGPWIIPVITSPASHRRRSSPTHDSPGKVTEPPDSSRKHHLSPFPWLISLAAMNELLFFWRWASVVGWCGDRAEHDGVERDTEIRCSAFGTSERLVAQQ